ncbi:MAG: hypothetical protein AB7O38_26725, partial [Pirellulaceae bacterium]
GSLDRRDWLEAQPADRQRSFLVALSGLFKYAGVDFEWRQLLEGLGGTNWWWFDMNTDGLLVWKERDDKAPTLVQLRDTGAAENITPPPAEIQVLTDNERQQVLLDRSPIYWREWVAAWESRQSEVPTSFSAADSPPRIQNGMPTPR